MTKYDEINQKLDQILLILKAKKESNWVLKLLQNNWKTVAALGCILGSIALELIKRSI